MTGLHEAPPLGSQAREATAPPYHGRHRAEDGWARCDRCHLPAVKTPDGRWVHAEAADAAFCGFLFADTYDRPFDD